MNERRARLQPKHQRLALVVVAVVVLVAAIAISVGIGLVGSDRALRSVNQRTTLTPTPRWQDHR